MRCLSRRLDATETSIHREGKNHQSVRFYDEREWRYVSRLLQGEYRYGLKKDDYTNEALREAASRHIYQNEKVEFEPANVKYIIVSEEDEILPLIHEIDRVKGRFSHDEVRILSTRLLTANQVRVDF